MLKQFAIIMGAGPAGLTAAFELLKKTEIVPIILEKSNYVGGISRTVNYKGNRVDMGGHRFFSKSSRVVNWWLSFLPMQAYPSSEGPDPEKVDVVMLFRRRVSRIFYLGHFFDYPISLNKNTLLNLGFIRLVKIVLSYLKYFLFPIKHEKNLEDFFINRFGRELYLTFFKDYSEKVWGIGCKNIAPEWGTQRAKGLSITKAILYAFSKLTLANNININQKKVETSLIKHFMYPKLGPGQLWEEVARQIELLGGRIYLNSEVIKISFEEQKVSSIEAKTDSGIKIFKGDYFFSSIPVKDLVNNMSHITIPTEVSRVANGLVYRDFVTVGLLLNKLKIKNQTNIPTLNELIPDNWIYIQERNVKLGRIQVFNNWSPYLVQNKDLVWLGLEYFCSEGDSLSSMKDDTFIKFAIDELVKIDFIDKEDVRDATIIRLEKTYPAYFGTYDNFSVVKNYLGQFENLFLIGRNGMHRYNNMDHSMLTAMTSVDNIINGIKSKENIWAINTEEEYHEEKSS